MSGGTVWNATVSLFQAQTVQKAYLPRPDGVQVLLQVKRLDLALPCKLEWFLHWSNWNGAPDLHQLLWIKKWASEIKEFFFSSLPWWGDGPCAELPAEITNASEEATPVRGCARRCREPKHTCAHMGAAVVVRGLSVWWEVSFLIWKCSCFAVSVLERLKSFVTKMLGRLLGTSGGSSLISA